VDDDVERVGSLNESFERDWLELLDRVGVDPPPLPEDDRHRDKTSRGLDLSDAATVEALVSLQMTWINSLTTAVDRLSTRLRKLERERRDGG
jgi:hypothetical protein